MDVMRSGLRTVPAIALAWGGVWFGLAMTIGTVVGIVRPQDIGPGEEPIALAPWITLAGSACGAVFGCLLAVMGRRSEARPFLAVQVALGTLVAAAFPLVMGKGAPEVLVIGPAGAISAVASAAVLRRLVALRPRVRAQGF